MAVALRELRYFDFEARQQVVIPAGAEIDAAALVRNKVDLDKLARVKHIEQESLVVAPKPKRGRPRKGG